MMVAEIGVAPIIVINPRYEHGQRPPACLRNPNIQRTSIFYHNLFSCQIDRSDFTILTITPFLIRRFYMVRLRFHSSGVNGNTTI